MISTIQQPFCNAVAMNTRTHFLVIALTSIFLAIAEPNVLAVVPPPDGGYAGFTTAEGTKALQSLTTGSGNTGLGWVSLFTNTTGSFNTGVGAGTLVLNTAFQNTATGAAALLSNSTGSPEHSQRRIRAFLQHNWRRQYSHWHQCAPKQHRRNRKHGDRLRCSPEQPHGRQEYRDWHTIFAY